VVLADGRRLAYKSQLPPTVEPAFYASASSPLLAKHQALGPLGACETTALEWIDAPLLRAVASDEADLVRRARGLIEQIGAIRGDLPALVDVGSPAALEAVAEPMLHGLDELVRSGRFRSVDPSGIGRVRAWARSDAVRALLEGGTRLTHGDLRADQVFVTDDGDRVIDWQRPVMGPADLDLAGLLIGERIDPRPHVSATVVALHWFLLLRWAVVAQLDILPDLPGVPFERWAAHAVRRIPGPGASRAPAHP
jgi:hypothetical protein